MSERLNSVDIEDVLSSIRRLVSDDVRTAPKAAAAESGAVAGDGSGSDPAETDFAAPAQEGEPAVFTSARRDADDSARRRPVPVADPQADKLILTPSLRIVPDAVPETEDRPTEPIQAPALAEDEAVAEAPMIEDAPEVEDEADMAAPVVAAPFHSIRIDRGDARLGAVMDQVTQGLDAGAQDWEPAGEAPLAFASGWEDEVAGDQLPPVQAGGHEAADVLSGGDVPSEAATSFMPDAVVAESLGWPAPDWRSDAPPAQAELSAEPTPADELLAHAGGEARVQEPSPSAENAVEAIGGNTPSMAEEIAMTEKDEAADLPDWARMEAEPEPAGADFEAAATAAAGLRSGAAAGDARWADAAEAQIRRELEEEVQGSAFARFDEEDHDDRRFDEEMLRDLVRDIIREELQGALGERITRNVRKLVRAEIARAMAVRDFE